MSDERRTDQENASATEDGGAGGRWPAERLRPVLEALLFAAAEPLSLRRLSDTVEGATTREIRAGLELLEQQCRDRGIRLVEVAGGWQLRTAPEHHTLVKRLFKERPFRLTRASLETVAVVAYRQPVTRAEVEAIRGVDCSGVLESLVERRLIRIAGRRDVPGRPLVYATTPRFLEVFGLKDLKALPTLAELGSDVEGLAERAGFAGGAEANAGLLPLTEGSDDGSQKAEVESAESVASENRHEEDDGRE